MSAITRQFYELRRDDGEPIRVESVRRDDWSGISDPCPECYGTEFNHVRYEGGHYGLENDSIIMRTDYWDQKDGIYTACKQCDTVLNKHPAYDLIRTIYESNKPVSD